MGQVDILTLRADALNVQFGLEGDNKLDAKKLKEKEEIISAAIDKHGEANMGYVIAQLIGQPQFVYADYKPFARKIFSPVVLQPGEDYNVPSSGGTDSGDFEDLTAYWLGEAGKIKMEKLVGSEVTIKPSGMATPHYYITLDQTLARKWDIFAFYNGLMGTAMNKLEDYHAIQLLAAAVPTAAPHDHTIAGSANDRFTYVDSCNAVEALWDNANPAYWLVPSGVAMDIIRWNYDENRNVNIWTDATSENMLKDGQTIGRLFGADIIIVKGRTRIAETDDTLILGTHKVYLVAKGVGVLGPQVSRQGKSRWAITNGPFSNEHYPGPTYSMWAYQRIVEAVTSKYRIVEITIPTS